MREVKTMKRDPENKWEVVIPEQRLCVASSREEARQAALAVLKGTSVKFEVGYRTHGPERCWCGDDHSP